MIPFRESAIVAANKKSGGGFSEIVETNKKGWRRISRRFCYFFASMPCAFSV